MKKEYCAPLATALSLAPCRLLATSLLNNQVGNGVQLSNERLDIEDWQTED